MFASYWLIPAKSTWLSRSWGPVLRRDAEIIFKVLKDSRRKGSEHVYSTCPAYLIVIYVHSIRGWFLHFWGGVSLSFFSNSFLSCSWGGGWHWRGSLKFPWIATPRKVTAVTWKWGTLQKTTVNPIGKPSFLGSMAWFSGVTPHSFPNSRPDTTLREQLSSAKAVADAPGAAVTLSKMIAG